MEFERTLLTAQEDVLTLSVCLVKTGESTINNSIDVFACNKSLPGHVSATDKVDYSSASLIQSITFAPTENRQCFNVDIIDDMVVETNETFAACVRTDSDFVEIGPNNSTTVVIVDNDGELNAVDNFIMCVVYHSLMSSLSHVCNTLRI